jgi:CRISPR type I-E-associated protein CasB/Cse2
MTTTASSTPSIERVLSRVRADPGALAALRRGVGRSLEESPDSWPYVIDVVGTQRWREPAAHLTLSLFALHQQSQSQGAMNLQGWRLGRACRVLGQRRGTSGASEQGIERRFRAALASETPEALGVHLRGLVTLLRGAGIPLDYTLLYRDLCAWLWSNRRDRVCLSWARDYFSTSPEDNEQEES